MTNYFELSFFPVLSLAKICGTVESLLLFRFLISPELTITHHPQPLYMAPEILSMQHYDATADLWSVGVILYEMLTGTFRLMSALSQSLIFLFFFSQPYRGSTPLNLLDNIKRLEVVRPSPASNMPSISDSCWDLLCRLLTREPARRCSFEEFFSHPFIKPPSPMPLPPPPPVTAIEEEQDALTNESMTGSSISSLPGSMQDPVSDTVVSGTNTTSSESQSPASHGSHSPNAMSSPSTSLSFAFPTKALRTVSAPPPIVIVAPGASSSVSVASQQQQSSQMFRTVEIESDLEDRLVPVSVLSTATADARSPDGLLFLFSSITSALPQVSFLYRITIEPSSPISTKSRTPLTSPHPPMTPNVFICRESHLFYRFLHSSYD